MSCWCWFSADIKFEMRCGCHCLRWQRISSFFSFLSSKSTSLRNCKDFFNHRYVRGVLVLHKWLFFFWRLSKVATLPRQMRTYSFPVFWDGWGMLPKLPYVRNVRRSDSLLMQAVPCWISSLPPGVYRTPPRTAMEPYQGDPQLLSVIYLINSAVIYLRLKRQRSYFVTFVSVSPHSKVGFLLPILCEVA